MSHQIEKKIRLFEQFCHVGEKDELFFYLRKQWVEKLDTSYQMCCTSWYTIVLCIKLIKYKHQKAYV